jgi:N-acetylglucosamine-6-sulfatase
MAAPCGRLLLGLLLTSRLVAPASGQTTAPRAPDTIRVESARLRPATARAAHAGRAELTFVLHDNSPRAAFAEVFFADHVRLTITDGGAFNATVAVRFCRKRPKGVLACRDAAGRPLLRVVTLQRRPAMYRARLLARRLPRPATGTDQPRGPVTVTLHREHARDLADVVTSCHAGRRGEVVCEDGTGPNILLIVTDDQRWDQMSVMTATIDRLANEGVTFSNAFVPTPLCCPGRASTLTGLYAHDHGVLQIGPPSGGAPAFVGRDLSTIATWLHDAGYRTGLFGKYMNSYAGQGPPNAPSWYVPPGWDEWDAFPAAAYYGYDLVHRDGTTTAYGAAAADYSTDVLSQKVQDFMSGAIAARVPFFALFAPAAPHVVLPFFLATPAPRHVGLFAALPPFRPPSWDESDVSDKPARIRQLPALAGTNMETYLDGLRITQLESLLAVDEAVAALTDLLDRTGQASNTVVVFTSDNGFQLGEHRLTAKEVPYEESIRVPLVVRYPPAIPAARSDPRFVMNVDLAPTLAALAGVVPPTPVDGRSLVPILGGAAAPWRDDVLLEEWKLGAIPDWVGVRNERWKYVQYLTGERELYDELNDPFELENVAGNPEHAATIATLAGRIAELTAPLAP